jgi:hypothetical protein
MLRMILMGKKQNPRAPVRITVDLGRGDHAALKQVVAALEAVSQADAVRRLIRYASENPQLFNARTA